MNFKSNKSFNQESDLVVPFTKGNLNKEAINKLTGIYVPEFDGKFGEHISLFDSKGRQIYLLGIGDEKDISRIRLAFQKFAFNTSKKWNKSIEVDCRSLEPNEIVQAATGLKMAEYNLGSFKSDNHTFIDSDVFFISNQDISSEINEGEITGQTINEIKSLVDAPSNQKTPEFIAEWARQSAKKYNYQCEILDKNQLEEQGFSAIIAVGQGSIYEPRLIKLSYTPNKEKGTQLGLVGKGITFDTGGLSIKPSQNLHYMKSDMGGAAVVLGVMEVVAKLKLNINVVGMVAAAENAVDAKAIRPGDVINSYSGKTIEIINTDAEGRLVLADTLNHIVKEYQPEYLIDLATLTGSVVRALGYSAAGMFTNNSDLAQKLSAIGESIHERVWPMPLYDDFDVDLHSDIADLKNLSHRPVAGAITAAKFLEAFTEEHDKWAHLDIAGVAFGDSDFAKMKSASGYGVRLIIEFLKTLQN
jgi:leucyl aminopeptidase